MTTIWLSFLLAQASPSPTSSTCPTTEVVRLTPNGPIPSATVPSKTQIPEHAVTVILVTVNPDGSVKSAVIQKSSGTPSLDAQSLADAKSSTYKPKTINCKPVEGTYLYRNVWTIG